MAGTSAAEAAVGEEAGASAELVPLASVCGAAGLGTDKLPGSVAEEGEPEGAVLGAGDPGTAVVAGGKASVVGGGLGTVGGGGAAVVSTGTVTGFVGGSETVAGEVVGGDGTVVVVVVVVGTTVTGGSVVGGRVTVGSDTVTEIGADRPTVVLEPPTGRGDARAAALLEAEADNRAITTKGAEATIQSARLRADLQKYAGCRVYPRTRLLYPHWGIFTRVLREILIGYLMGSVDHEQRGYRR
jgi:hypothetical protein